MLFPYSHNPHDFDRMQELADIIFFDVLLAAKNGDLQALLDSKPRLAGLVKDLRAGRGKAVTANRFLASIKDCYDAFRQLSDADLQYLEQQYRNSNDIEAACNGTVTPCKMSDLEVRFPDLCEPVSHLFEFFWNHNFLNLKAVRKHVSTLKSHYEEFIKANRPGICPFCGLEILDNEHDRTREAYDHYLSKAKYPFSTANTRNLAPACHKCNSGNKNEQDPLYSREGQRRKAFYPFSRKQYIIELRVSFHPATIFTTFVDLPMDDVEITLHSGDGIDEEIATWRDIFYIDRRYKTRICSAEAQVWLSQAVDECQNYGLDPAVYLLGKLSIMRKNPYSDQNYLKIAFYEECERKGYINGSVFCGATGKMLSKL